MKQFLTIFFAVCSICTYAASNSNPEHIQSVKAISTVCGQGRTVETIIIEYDVAIKNHSLSLATYQVIDGDVLNVYANTLPCRSEKGANGKYVIIELKADTDLNVRPKKAKEETAEERQERDRLQGGPGLKAGWSTGGNDIYPGNAVIKQVQAIKTTKGITYPPTTAPIVSTIEECPLVDKFQQLTFRSPYTGQVLPYNLYIPEDYDPNISYPLVLFIHDAGAVSTEVKQTLVQGRGAIVWATPELQKRHPCIVVAPQYPYVTVDDNWSYSHHLDATIELLKELQTHYSIDANRIYTTGQSMGCMSSIVMMLKEPNLFAGALLVAGKWDPSLMTPLVNQNIWIISCEGDGHSNQLQGEAVELWRKEGAYVAEATWNMESSEEEFAQLVKEMREGNPHLLFTHFTGGNHRATWYIAYDIEGVQNWLFEQRKH